ncbi:Paladin [Clarias magur]|uniref:Paladin n=1 Tax=Clarias magur TaxID=1594786 RepID=A0A8J4UVH3_CLAMG|nr:Paladin [Clarias magur]
MDGEREPSIWLTSCKTGTNQCLTMANMTSCPPHNVHSAVLGPLPPQPTLLP